MGILSKPIRKVSTQLKYLQQFFMGMNNCPFRWRVTESSKIMKLVWPPWVEESGGETGDVLSNPNSLRRRTPDHQRVATCKINGSGIRGTLFQMFGGSIALSPAWGNKTQSHLQTNQKRQLVGQKLLWVQMRLLRFCLIILFNTFEFVDFIFVYINFITILNNSDFIRFLIMQGSCLCLTGL